MDVLASLPWWPLVLAAILAFAESALGVGALFPGEVAIVALAATLEAEHTIAAVLIVTLGATAGDHVGYLLGRWFGPRLAESALIRRVGRRRWDVATTMVQRHGMPAVVISRLLPLVRTVMPAVAGVARLGYLRFLVASTTGSLLWAAFWVGTGGALGAGGLLGNPWFVAAMVISAAIAATVLTVRARRSSRARRADAEQSEATDHPLCGASRP